MARWLPRGLALALLLVGGSLVVGGLFLPWYHLANADGSPYPGPDIGIIPPFVPAVNWGFGDGLVQLMLEYAGFAVAAGLVALLLSVRPPPWLKVLLVLLAVLLVAPTPLVLYTFGGLEPIALNGVAERLECVGIGVGVGLVVVLLSVRRFGRLKALLLLLITIAGAASLGGLASILIIKSGPGDCACRAVSDAGAYLSGMGYVLILLGDALVGWALADAGTPAAMQLKQMSRQGSA